MQPRTGEGFGLALEQRIIALLNERHVGMSVTPELMRSVKRDIFQHVNAAFHECDQHVSYASLVWLTDHYFKTVTLGTVYGNVKIEEIRDSHESCSGMTFYDFMVLRRIFEDSSLLSTIDDELQKRRDLP